MQAKTKDNHLELTGQIGFIENGEDSSCIAIGAVPFVPAVMAMMDKYGNLLSVRYWICDRSLSPDEMKKGFLENMYGSAEADYSHAYSELTGYLWTDQSLKVGGHDLADRLTADMDKYCHIEIDFNKSPPT